MSESKVSESADDTVSSDEFRERETYNYKQFDTSVIDEDRGIVAGDCAVDCELYTLDGDTVRLADLWSERPIVVEFGSITCPVFTDKTDHMDALARAYDDVDFYVVYTREAHPGQRYSAHTCLEEKLSNAAAARDAESIERTVLVDGVAGTMHKQYVSMPNAAYVIGRDGMVAYQADWLDPETLTDTLEMLLENDGRSVDVPGTNLHGNFADPSASLLADIHRVFTRAGPGAARDFFRALPGLLRYRLRERLKRS